VVVDVIPPLALQCASCGGVVPEAYPAHDAVGGVAQIVHFASLPVCSLLQSLGALDKC
jgi:hypothetical protein